MGWIVLERPRGGQLPEFTAMCRGLAFSALGKLTVRIPFVKVADTWVLSTRSGKVIVRDHRPTGRSCRR